MSGVTTAEPGTASSGSGMGTPGSGNSEAGSGPSGSSGQTSPGNSESSGSAGNFRLGQFHRATLLADLQNFNAVSSSSGAVPPVPVLHVQVQEALILKITIRSNLASQADREGNIFDTQNRTGGLANEGWKGIRNDS